MNEGHYSLQKSWEFYRACNDSYVSTQGIETRGIFDIDDFETIIRDPNTTNLNINKPSQSDVVVPLLTPYKNRSNWFHTPYYETMNQGAVPMYYYNHLAPLFESSREDYISSLFPILINIASHKGLVIFDHSDKEATLINHDLAVLFDRIGVTANDITESNGIDGKHYHYTSKAISGARSEKVGIEGLYNTYAVGVKSGIIRPEAGVKLESVLGSEDIAAVWDFYKPTFDQISQVDPVYSGFDEQELAGVLQSPEYMKFVYRAGRTIVNLGLITDISGHPWMNQQYYKQKFEKQYENKQILYSPGIIANTNARERVASSLQTIGALGKLIRLAEIEPVFTFACNSISNKQVPGLTERSLRRAGIETDFKNPVSHQLFRVLKLSLNP